MRLKVLALTAAVACGFVVGCGPTATTAPKPTEKKMETPSTEKKMETPPSEKKAETPAPTVKPPETPVKPPETPVKPPAPPAPEKK